jgi:hypothetical protein
MKRFVLLMLVGAGFVGLAQVAVGDSAPPGATARCNDGTYSFSQTHSGTCSHHGGVAVWLDGSGSSSPPTTTTTARSGSPPAPSTGGTRHGAVTASATLTPGALNPAVTQVTIGMTICVSGWTRTVRPPASYTNTLKLKQMTQYNETGPPSAYEEDHLIPLELGGAPRDPRNLWPEPHPRANSVDQVENSLKRQVCTGAISLAAARTKISMIKHTQG